MLCTIYKLDFKEKNLNLDRDSNLGSPSEVRIPKQVQICLLKIDFMNFICNNLGLTKEPRNQCIYKI